MQIFANDEVTSPICATGADRGTESRGEHVEICADLRRHAESRDRGTPRWMTFDASLPRQFPFHLRRDRRLRAVAEVLFNQINPTPISWKYDSDRPGASSRFVLSPRPKIVVLGW